MKSDAVQELQLSFEGLFSDQLQYTNIVYKQCKVIDINVHSHLQLIAV